MMRLRRLPLTYIVTEVPIKPHEVFGEITELPKQYRVRKSVGARYEGSLMYVGI
jgi:hypothetical protein